MTKKNKHIEIMKEFTTKQGHKAFIIKYDLLADSPQEIKKSTGIKPHLCGYVGVDKRSRLYKKHYAKKLDFLLDKELQKQNMEEFFDVHGGITFSYFSHKKELNTKLWLIGFDCAHFGDTPEKCNKKYVEKEIEKLSKQLKEVDS